MVSGKISHSVDTQTIQEFKDNLFSCIAEVPIHHFQNKHNLSLFPKTTTKGLELTTEHYSITDYNLYDVNGKFLSSKAFNPSVKNLEVDLQSFGAKLNYLETGPIYLQAITDKGEITWRVAWTNH